MNLQAKGAACTTRDRIDTPLVLKSKALDESKWPFQRVQLWYSAVSNRPQGCLISRKQIENETAGVF